MTADPDDRVLFQLLCTLGTNVDEPAFAALTKITLAHIEDSWFQIAALSAAPVSAVPGFERLNVSTVSCPVSQTGKKAS